MQLYSFSDKVNKPPPEGVVLK